MRVPVRVVGAVIVNDGLILCAQRATGPLAGLWEFPGGKVETDEAPQAALVREIAEELGCQIEVGDEIAMASLSEDSGTVTMTTYRCTVVSGSPVASEHAQLAWLRPGELGELEWAPLDLPTVDRLARNGDLG